MSLDIGHKDTICALSSAQGLGAISIVRASGPDAEKIFRKLFRAHREIKPFYAMYGEVIDAQLKIVDEVMAILFPDARSFTGEPSFEIHCHGNPVIVDEILEIICASGGRLAGPGEFSLRAMQNGKIDLTQAESIADLIHARSRAATAVALRGIQGGLKEKILAIREIIVHVIAEIEARMDFPDEDLGGYNRTLLLEKMDLAIASLEFLLRHANTSIKLHQGARIVICGVPNAGKSTLLNHLCGEEKSIVHETPGTTRDVIEAYRIIGGVPVVFVDVAGIRSMTEADAVEKIGISRAFSELNCADLIIWLADCTVPDPFSDVVIKDALAALTAPVLKVLNKAELLDDQKKLTNSAMTISAKLGLGMNDLEALLHRHLTKDVEPSELFITRARQKEELNTALSHLREARSVFFMKYADEVVTSELRAAGLAFDRLNGSELSEDILDKIFSEFCIGK